MSVIVEHPVFDATGRLVFSGGPLFLYCKGADSAILARTLAPSTAAEGQRNSFSKQQLQVWGNDGLRTLAFGYRELVRSDYETWNVEYHGECALRCCTTLEASLLTRRATCSRMLRHLRNEEDEGQAAQSNRRAHGPH